MQKDQTVKRSRHCEVRSSLYQKTTNQPNTKTTKYTEEITQDAKK